MFCVCVFSEHCLTQRARCMSPLSCSISWLSHGEMPSQWRVRTPPRANSACPTDVQLNRSRLEQHKLRGTALPVATSNTLHHHKQSRAPFSGCLDRLLLGGMVQQDLAAARQESRRIPAQAQERRTTRAPVPTLSTAKQNTSKAARKDQQLLKAYFAEQAGGNNYMGGYSPALRHLGAGVPASDWVFLPASTKRWRKVKQHVEAMAAARRAKRVAQAKVREALRAPPTPASSARRRSLCITYYVRSA